MCTLEEEYLLVLPFECLVELLGVFAVYQGVVEAREEYYCLLIVHLLH